jgi:acyl-CoA reductase-like NAD-dependent aldehyde dehydrogenase
MTMTQRGATAPTSGSQDQVELNELELVGALNELHEQRDRWASTSPRERAEILAQLLRDTLAVADEWNAAACEAKGYRADSAEGAEELFSGIGTFVRMAQAFRTSLIDIAEKGRPNYPGPVHHKANDRIAIQVMPASSFDRLLYGGITGEVWMNEGVTEAQVRERQAIAYRNPLVHRGVSLVLGAGNVASLGPRDVLSKLFVEGKVVLLKANPVNDYLTPFWTRAMAALIEPGFLRIVSGGAQVGAFLTQHDLVDDIHVTGSDKTHDAIVFGSGDDGARRKAANQPLITKPISGELGNVSPVIIVPGVWSAQDIAYQAAHVATMLTNNAGFNCLTPRVIVTHAGWSQRAEFFDALETVLASLPTRRAYYPGARTRFDSFISAHRDAHQIGDASEDKLPWTVVRDVDPNAANEICLNVEAFCSLTSETALHADSVTAFIERAVTFCNETVWGTLSMTLIAHPDSLRDPEVGPAIEQAIGDLRYGSIGLNLWHAMSFAFCTTAWGAYPGHVVTDIQSGSGFVGNAFMFDSPLKSVVRGPFRSRPTPVWFATTVNVRVMRKLLAFEVNPSWRKVLGLLATSLRG